MPVETLDGITLAIPQYSREQDQEFSGVKATATNGTLWTYTVPAGKIAIVRETGLFVQGSTADFTVYAYVQVIRNGVTSKLAFLSGQIGISRSLYTPCCVILKAGDSCNSLWNNVDGANRQLDSSAQIDEIDL